MAVNLGGQTLYMYPTLSATMTHAEKSYGFMMTQTALESADIHIKSKLQVLSDKTNTSALVVILKTRFVEHAVAFIRQPGKFNVVSYHNHTGKTIATAMLDTGLLRPVDNQTNNTRRPSGLQFVKIQSDIKFDTINPKVKGVHPFSFFVRLFTQSLPVLNSTGNQVQLDTFHGADDWFQGNQAQLDAIWDNPKSVGKPFQLLAPSIQDNLTDATIESNYALLEKIALEASWDYITSQIYQQICPQVGVDPPHLSFRTFITPPRMKKER
jgi:hypothetical protein